MNTKQAKRGSTESAWATIICFVGIAVAVGHFILWPLVVICGEIFK